MEQKKKLYRSTEDKAIFGVCGGIAEYFGIDSIIVRLVMVLFALAFGSGVLFYILAAIIMPKKPEDGFEPVQPAQPGAYNAGGQTYVNRAAAEPMYSASERIYEEVPKEFSEDAASEEPAEEPIGPDIPEEPQTEQAEQTYQAEQTQRTYQAEQPKQTYQAEQPYQCYQAYPQSQPAQKPPKSSGDKTRTVLGVILLLLGVAMLIKIFVPAFNTRILVALCLIVGGCLLIFKKE